MQTDNSLPGILIVERDKNGLISICQSTGNLPSDAGKFSVGCLLVHTTLGNTYTNTGTTASPSWDDTDLPDNPLTEADLTGGTGSAALISTDAGATVGPALTLHRNSASPAAFDFIGQLALDGESDASAQVTYAGVTAVIADPTDGAEVGFLVFQTAVGAGGLELAGSLSSDGTTASLTIGDPTQAGAINAIVDASGSLVLRTGNDVSLSILARGDGSIIMEGAVVYTDIVPISGAGAVPITGRVVEFTSTATGNALTLANGTQGQRLTILYVAEGAGGDTGVLTPATLAGGTTITFNALGDTAELAYSSTGGWYMVGGSAVIA